MDTHILFISKINYNIFCNVFTAVGPNGVISGDKKIPKECFVKHCDQRRKYPVLYKLEFQVNN